MNKQVYLKPEIRVIQQGDDICDDPMNHVSNSEGFNYGGAGTGPAQARSITLDDWDEDLLEEEGNETIHTDTLFNKNAFFSCATRILFLGICSSIYDWIFAAAA